MDVFFKKIKDHWSFLFVYFILIFSFLFTNLYIHRFGDNSSSYITLGGTYKVFQSMELYRLFMSLFIHISWAHLFSNLIFLTILYFYGKNYISDIALVFYLFVTGIIGMSVATVFYPQVVFVGFSGAIESYLGFVVVMNLWDEFEYAKLNFKLWNWKRIIPIIVILFYGILLTQSSNIGTSFIHLIGFFIGIVSSVCFNLYHIIKK